jgi:hypothetical protein
MLTARYHDCLLLQAQILPDLAQLLPDKFAPGPSETQALVARYNDLRLAINAVELRACHVPKVPQT